MLRLSILRSLGIVAVVFFSLAGPVGPVFGQWENGVQIGPDLPGPSEGPQSTAEDNFIDFDDVVAPCGFIDTVALTDEYAAQGVIFSGPGGNDGAAVVDQCGNWDVMGHSPPNFLGLNEAGVLSDGGIPIGPETMTFTPPASQVSIKTGRGWGVHPVVTMECFDADDQSVGSDSVIAESMLQTLTVSAPTIKSCVLSHTPDAVMFDDLQWEVGGPACGNGILDPGEECDDGNNDAGDGCGPTCFFEDCGNGIIDPGEECDDGNYVDGDGCSSHCLLEVCGNGILDAGEECDDGNNVDGDGCASDCILEEPVPAASGRALLVLVLLLLTITTAARLWRRRSEV